MIVIGLTGGIGSGKSTISCMLAELGAHIIDADEISRQAVAPGAEAHRRLVEEFGPEILAADGSIDRTHLAKIAFSSAENTERLNRATHLEIIQMIDERLGNAQAEVVVIDAPLLFEAGLDQRVDKVWVVYVDPKTQLERLQCRPDRNNAIKRISAQMPLEDKRKRADVVIDNSGSLAETRRQVLAAWRRLAGKP